MSTANANSNKLQIRATHRMMLLEEGRLVSVFIGQTFLACEEFIVTLLCTWKRG
jgi:hypothetical protein